MPPGAGRRSSRAGDIPLKGEASPGKLTHALDVTNSAGSHSLRVERTDAVLDPLTGLGGRVKLMCDLAEAVRAGSPQSLLAIVYFEGFGGKTRRREDRGSRAALAERCTVLARALEPAACYRLREAEFATIIYAPATEAFKLLDQAVSLLEAEEATGFHPVFSAACVLPHEAANPLAALGLAGERLTFSQRGREAREQAIEAATGTR